MIREDEAQTLVYQRYIKGLGQGVQYIVWVAGDTKNDRVK
jgi:hypothetical protein